jgi:hypothetical protein
MPNDRAEDSGIKMLATIRNLAQNMERELALPPGLFMSLIDEGDWSFVIKTHAVIEGALSHQLARATKDKRLEPVFQRLELSNKDTGKLAFLTALELLDAKQRAFVRKLSELRNRLVHDVRNTTFTFAEYVSALDSNQRKAFSDAVVGWADIGSPEVRATWRQGAITDPKTVIWFTMLILVEAVYRHSLKHDLEREFEDAKDGFFQNQSSA